jgi:hypothetical protein
VDARSPQGSEAVTTHKPLTREQRGAVVGVLIDHQAAIDERNANRADKHVLPDLSDIYTGTIMRLRVMFRKFDQR